MVIQANFGSMDGSQAELGTKVEELIQVIEDLMARVNSTEWEADDRNSYQELQEMWNSEDNSLQDVLREIAGQVGTAREGYQSTIAHNAGRF
ncbi:WXG100 family type VII secretion target [Stackebrandtia nassauensis]|uniref:ESAT-6-like protein n=1 Tax=Stackebrandtia nassauensis (strain DSM 44728 / CIP 108903 / NRRL B-16338 / NBRC 102104 / LLR-40K-21) TaxID=446470 RepID=D3Q9Z1_STANL|nr:hypothetical protein [Stackebrandtia nassauensis]ADD40703.1 hypothetical protein Snas_0993 [Stackebrandtia nassauensis DSM 44728]